MPTGGDGYRFDSSLLTTGPKLTVEYRTAPCSTPPSIITQPPATLAVTEPAAFSLTAGISVCSPTYQWTKNGADIPGANSASYSVASSTAGNSGSYRLRVTNPNGTVTTDPAVVTVTADTTGPRVLSASGGTDPTSVTITFSKPVSAATAQNTANYSLSPSLAVSAAVLSANGTTVTLTTAARTIGTRYTITIRDIRDTRVSSNLLNPNPTVGTLVYQVRLLTFTDAWKYEESGTDLGSAWRASGYNDSAWPSGPGILGFETTANTLTYMVTVAPPNGTNTVLSLTNNAGQTNPTIYFRTTFSNPHAAQPGISYSLHAYIDDGAVWYLNGTESGRYNISNTPTLFNTLADAGLTEPTPAPSTTVLTTSLAGVGAGLNHMAAEVHQSALNSSDIAWGAEILANFGGLIIVQNLDGSVTISWPIGGTLQEAAAVTGPWSSSSSQANPQTRAASGAARFFRVQLSP